MTCICPPEGPFKVKQTQRIIEREGNLCAAAQTDRDLRPPVLLFSLYLEMPQENQLNSPDMKLSFQMHLNTYKMC